MRYCVMSGLLGSGGPDVRCYPGYERRGPDPTSGLEVPDLGLRAIWPSGQIWAALIAPECSHAEDGAGHRPVPADVQHHQFCGGSLAGKESMPHCSTCSGVDEAVSRGSASGELMSLGRLGGCDATGDVTPRRPTWMISAAASVPTTRMAVAATGTATSRATDSV